MFNRKIVGWQLASPMRTDLVLDALRMALGTRQLGADLALVQHTDRVNPPNTSATTTRRSSTTIACSRRSVRSATPTTLNALAKSFLDTFKTELIKDRVWHSNAKLELAILEYVHWFNHDRLHDSLGDLPSVEFEALADRQCRAITQ